MLHPSQILAYTSALSIAVAIPGPGITAVIARTLSGGIFAGFALLAGIVLGDLTYLSFAVFGLAFIAEHFKTLFLLVNWGAAFYLAWLAKSFLLHQPTAINIDKKASRGELAKAWLSGLTITLGNPKTMVFYVAVLPLIISLDSIFFDTWAFLLIPLTSLVLIAVGSFFVVSATKVRGLLASEKAQKIMFRGAGCIMLTAAISMMIKSL